MRDTTASQNHGPLISDRVEQLLRKEIALRQHEPNAQLKYEADMAKQFSVSLKTIRVAMERLKKEGLVYAIRGKGTFIKPQQQTNITLISSHQSHPHSMMAVGVATSLLGQQGYTANLVISNNLIQDWAAIENAQPNSFGAILVGQFHEQDLCWLAKKTKTPFVLVGDSDATFRMPAQYNHVLSNNSATTFRATDYLLNQGHTKIGYITWSPLDQPAYIKESNDGFVAALQSRGIEPNPAWQIALPPANFPTGQQTPDLSRFDQAKQKFNDWQSSDNAPTALLIHSALELQIRDILETYCRDQFTRKSIIPIIAYEQLYIGYTGMGEMTATCWRFEYLVKRSLAMLIKQQNQPTLPIREICDQSFMCFRENGIWKTADLENPVALASVY